MADEKRPVERCPFCGSEDLRKFDELRDGVGEENLTAEELDGYRAGRWGTLICNGCGIAIDYQLQ